MPQQIRLNNKEKLAFMSVLGTMLSSGIPILEVVESLLEDSKGRQQKIFTEIKNDLNQGKTLSESLHKFPQTFDQVTLNLLKASEESGTLAETLKNITISVRKSIEFNEKVKAALTYPLFVIGVFIGVMVMILSFVVPRIAQVFLRLKVSLPLPTKILIILSEFFVQYYLAIFVVIAASILLSVFYYQNHRKAFLDAVFSLPVLKKLAISIDLTRFTSSMSLLLKSGIPITDALELSSQVVDKKEVEIIIKKAHQAVKNGKNLAESLRDKHKVVLPLILQLTDAGEKSGSLEKSMQEASEYMEQEVNNNLKAFTVLLEPIMLVIIGILVGGMMLAIIAPIYGLIGQIQTR